VRPPSVETELRTVKRELREARAALAACRLSEHAYRARATNAEQELKSWKARFDELLFRRGKEEG
jgi:hypothetical protein